MNIPSTLEWWRSEPGGAEWLEALPEIVAACSWNWSLRVGAPFPGSNVSLVLAVERQDGTPAVLKINFPDEESSREPDALRVWDGRGAVRLVEYDDERRALLIERCKPGTYLWSIEDDALATRIAAQVLESLWRPPPAGHAFVSLADAATRWAQELPSDWEALRQPFELEILEAAVGACLELGPNQTGTVVLHQDFHGGNVLRRDDAWVAIDPKPLVGEREFDAASLLRDRRWLLGGADDAVRIRARLDILEAELGLDRERMRRWGIAHALAWGVGDRKVENDMVECARIMLTLGT